MGKKGRKTRWRTLAIDGESDSEESSTLTRSQIPKNLYKPYYSKFSYSSQSTPTRRYQHDAKSTRSSSTASENKITFNEDEYTRITTPRQDVLFKKGYLNKPKNYQTQTSTGNSTTSTGNSTGNGTPDHQSADGTEGTDLEYDSQFVFPNAFVDQNGIYYINSYEPYPMVMYNHPMCYPEYPTTRSKRYSTDSLDESTSPHNEETSQDLSQSGGETAANVPELNQMYNVVYPGFYYNGVCGPEAIANGPAAEPRKVKKKRRRKASSKSNHDEATSSDDCDSSDEAVSLVENRAQEPKGAETQSPLRLEEIGAQTPTPVENHQPSKCDQSTETTPVVSERVEATNETNDSDALRTQLGAEEESKSQHHSEESTQTCQLDELGETPVGAADNDEVEEPSIEMVEETTIDVTAAPMGDEIVADTLKFNLNAEEFIPRAYRHHEPIQFVNIHPNFIPVPLLNPMNGANFNPAFLPPGIPINFIPPDPKLIPNFINLIPGHAYVPKPPEQRPEIAQEPKPTQENAQEPTKIEEIVEAKKEEPKVQIPKTDIDIAKIVSKLEEAAKEQRFHENRRTNFRLANKFNRNQKPRFSAAHQSEFRQYGSRSRNFERKKPERVEDSKDEAIAEETTTEIPIEAAESKTAKNQKSQSPRKYYARTESVEKAKSVNYSDTLKKSPTVQIARCPRFERHGDKTPSEAKPKSAERKTPTPPKSPKTPNQWISVSSRKKRKNRASLDADVEETIERHVEDGFESFDVTLLEDVVVAVEEKHVEERNQVVDSFIEMIKSEANPTENLDVVIQDVQDVEKQLLSMNEKTPKRTHSYDASSKKKSKKGGHKAPTKRIIITDVDLSQQLEPKPVEKPTQVEETLEPVETPIQIKTQEEKTVVLMDATTPDKKSKPKKKKKQPKNDVKSMSISSSTTTLNNLDDSYDFLLDTSIESEKTNDEISLELDKMIQKGLCTNLEGKIKSLNVPSVSDDFFRSISFKQSTPDKSYIKTIDLSVILKNAGQVYGKAKPVDIDFSKTQVPDDEPQPSTSKSGDFHHVKVEDNAEAKTPDAKNLSRKSNGKLKNKSKKNDDAKTKKEAKSSSRGDKGEASKRANKIVINSNPEMKEDNLKENSVDGIKGNEEIDKALQSSGEEILCQGKIDEDHIALEDLVEPVAQQNDTSNEFESTTAPLANSTICNDAECKEENVENLTEAVKNNDSLEELNTIDATNDIKDEKLDKIDANVCDLAKSIEEKVQSDITIDDLFKIKENEINNDDTINEVRKSNQLEVDTINEVIEMRQEEADEDEDSNVHLKETQPNVVDGGEHITEISKIAEINGNSIYSTGPTNKINVEDVRTNEKVNDVVESIKLTTDLHTNETVKDEITEENVNILNDSVADVTKSQKQIHMNGWSGDQIKINGHEETRNGYVKPEIPMSKISKDVKEENSTKTLYPITQAVRDWMTKTRENTPEVEILKSPDTIYREFIEDDSESEPELDAKNSTRTSMVSNASDDEITVFESWGVPRDVSVGEDIVDALSPSTPNFPMKNGCCGPIEEGEDVLEVYESKYGKNEDFLRLKAEVEERTKNANSPKHGDLPYRAICCSLM